MHVALRGLCVLALVAAVVGLGVHYAVAGPEYPYTTNHGVLHEYDETVGGEVFLFATFVEYHEDTSTAVVKLGGGDSSRTLTVAPVKPLAVSPGGRVQVYGTLAPDDHVTAERVVVVNPSKNTDQQKYVLSAVGAVLVLVTFFRQWTVDRDTLAFTPR